MLEPPGAQGAWEEGGAIHLYWPAEGWSAAILEEVKDKIRTLGMSADQVIDIQTLPDRDWNAQCAASV